MWYIIVGVVALIFGFLIGVYIIKHRSLPLFENEVRQKRLQCDKELADIEKHFRIECEKAEQNKNFTITSINNQAAAQINEIQAKTNLKIAELDHSVELKVQNTMHEVELGVAARKSELQARINELENDIILKKSALNEWTERFENWKTSSVHDMHLGMELRRLERESDLAAIEEQYRQRKEEVEHSIETIENLLATWSGAERAAYEEREGRMDAEARNKLALSDRSVRELKELYGACSTLSLSNPTPLYKAIYDVYLKGPVKELGTRIVGSSTVTGIYKIWNVESGKVYVGQSMDIAERWKQHIKRGTKCEVGTLAGASLYEAMWDDGVWCFRFEVLEVCDKVCLNEREKFWISYFQSNEIGYNKTKGNG